MIKTKDRGFLWSLEKNGNTSFLYGGFHLGMKEWQHVGEITMAAFDSCQSVGVEIDPFSESNALITLKFQQQVEIKPAVLPGPVAKRLWRLVAARHKKRNYNCWEDFVMHVCIDNLCISRGLEQKYGSETVFIKLANRKNKQIVELEKMSESRMRSLILDSEEETIKFIETEIKNLESGVAGIHFNKLIKCWETSDMECMELLRHDVTEVPLYNDRMDARNPQIAESIANAHLSTTIFAIVGAHHTIQLPDMLTALGFNVRRIF